MNTRTPTRAPRSRVPRPWLPNRLEAGLSVLAGVAPTLAVLEWLRKTLGIGSVWTTAGFTAVAAVVILIIVAKGLRIRGMVFFTLSWMLGMVLGAIAGGWFAVTQIDHEAIDLGAGVGAILGALLGAIVGYRRARRSSGATLGTPPAEGAG